uniref:Immunoglobulin subtype domain-containing protein n=1 Tax=Periophthalmus magnuspinnatus TaxID=409849 RepID=A0A3B4AFV0_9GOBI
GLPPSCAPRTERRSGGMSYLQQQEHPRVTPRSTAHHAVQDDVHFSVGVVCKGIPTLHWSFMSGWVSRAIGTWQPGNFTNITADYSGRVQPFTNGSMVLSNLRLQDAGFYVLTVTEEGGNSRDVGFVLKVTEVLYEDLQYLSVSALALGCVSALLMFGMWLLDKLYHHVRAWRRRKRMPGTFTCYSHTRVCECVF